MENLIDWDQLDMIADGYTEDFVEIYKEFCQEVPLLFRELEDALSRSDVKAVASVSHTLKGSSSNFGMIAMGEFLKKIEFHAKNGSLDGLTETLGETKMVFENSIALIRDQRKI
ncbi:MAG: Hpt domain-containing protein [Chthoniobacterales bacterium]